MTVDIYSLHIDLKYSERLLIIKSGIVWIVYTHYAPLPSLVGRAQAPLCNTVANSRGGPKNGTVLVGRASHVRNTKPPPAQ